MLSATTHRLLRLLGLLQRQPSWTSEALARALSVTPRTVRRDIDRLRYFGYAIHADLGPGGGYCLSGGAALPPLPLDADEALTVLLALREAQVNRATAGAAASAAAKLQNTVPTALRTSAAALNAHLGEVWVGRMIGASPRHAEPNDIALLARACRERRRVTCDAAGGADGDRLALEPQHLVRAMDRWWLLAHEVGTRRWLTLAVDELRALELTATLATHARFDGDAQQYITAHIRRSIQRVNATVRVHAPVEAVTVWVETAWGILRRETDTTTIVECGADTYDAIARWLLLIGADITVIEPDDLRQAFARVADTANGASTKTP